MNGKFIEEIFIRKKELELKKFLGEKYNKFSLRKLTVGVCSMTIGSFFLVSTVQPEENIVKAADNAIVHYKYVGEDNLTDKEKELIRKEVPSVVNSTEETYYLVFKPNKITQLNKLPNTGLNYGVGSMLLGGMLGLLVVVVAKGKNKSRKILSILLVTSMGATTLELPARAMEDLQLSVYNMDYNLKVGDRLPNISSIPGYSFVGFIKNEAETKKLKEEVKGNVNSQQNNKKQPQLKENTDVNVTDKKQENKATLNNPDTKAYTEEESGAIVEPEKVEPPKEYTGVQAGTIVEPEKVEATKDFTGKVEKPKAEAPSVDKKELASEVEKNGDLTSQDSFKDADEVAKKEYKEALKVANLVLSNANAKQDEVNNALETLKKASEKVSKGKSNLSRLLGDVFKKDKDKASVGLADVAKDQGMVANNSQVNLGTVGKSNSILAKTGTLALPTTFVGLALICLVYVLRRRKNTK